MIINNYCYSAQLIVFVNFTLPSAMIDAKLIVNKRMPIVNKLVSLSYAEFFVLPDKLITVPLRS